MHVPGTGIRFRTPGARVDVGSNELTLLRDELQKIAATNPPRPEVTSLIETLQVRDGRLGIGTRAFEPDEAESEQRQRQQERRRFGPARQRSPEKETEHGYEYRHRCR